MLIHSDGRKYVTAVRHQLSKRAFSSSRPIGVDLHETANWISHNATHFLKRADAALCIEVVDRVSDLELHRNLHQEREPFRSAQVQTPNAFGLAVHQRITRDVEAECLETGGLLHKVFDEKALGAAPDVKDTHPRLKTETRDNISGDRPPAPIVTIPTIAIFTRPVEIHLSKLLAISTTDASLASLLASGHCVWYWEVRAEG